MRLNSLALSIMISLRFTNAELALMRFGGSIGGLA